MPNAFTQKIHECAMETEDNLIVFVRAAQSFEELYKKLVSSFLNKLKEELMKKFPKGNGWQFFAIDLITKQYKKYEYLLYIQSESWSSPTLRVGIWAEDSFISIYKVKTPAFRRVDFISSPDADRVAKHVSNWSGGSRWTIGMGATRFTRLNIILYG